MITGLTPIDIKIKEVASLFQITKRRTKEEPPLDLDTSITHWLHPAFSISLLKEGNDEDSDLENFTDGSKTKQGVGAGVAIYTRGTLTWSLKFRLHDKCTNNQAEQMAILKSLLHMTKEHSPNKIVTIYTDRQTTLDSPMNSKIHTSLIDKIRLQVDRLEQTAWTIRFSWVRAHVGSRATNSPTPLLKKLQQTRTSQYAMTRSPKVCLKVNLNALVSKSGRRSGIKLLKAASPRPSFQELKKD